MVIFARIVVTILVLCLLSFVMWKKMRGDYENDDIFSGTFLLIVMGLMGAKFGLYLAEAGILLGLVGWCRYKKWDVWEWGDSFGLYSMLLVAVTFNLWAIGLGVVGYLGLMWVGKSYRGFRWYKSGRMGMVGLLALGWWGIINAVVAKFATIPVYSAVWIWIIVLTVLYLRSGRIKSRT